MPIKTLFILITLLSILTSIIANEESLIIETENQTIEAIIKADENIGTRSNKSLDKEKILAVLCVVTNFILENNKPLTVSTLPATATVTEGEVFTVPTVTALTGDSPKIVYMLDGVPTEAGATFDTLTVGEHKLVVVVTETGVDDKETAKQVQVITVKEKEVVDQPTDFSQLTIKLIGPLKGLEGEVSDSDGIASVKIVYSDGTVSNYPNGTINNEPVYLPGTTYTITVTDDNNVVKTKTGTL